MIGVKRVWSLDSRSDVNACVQLFSPKNIRDRITYFGSLLAQQRQPLQSWANRIISSRVDFIKWRKRKFDDPVVPHEVP